MDRPPPRLGDDDRQPVATRPLGRFHPAVAAAVAEVCRRRDAAVVVVRGGTTVELAVPADRRDDLRAELVTSWEAVLAALDPDDQLDVRAGGGALPGWVDAPDGVWVDRDGRLRVGGHDDDADAEDTRVLGPVLMTAGGLLVLLALYTGDGMGRLFALVTGTALVLVGLFLPR